MRLLSLTIVGVLTLSATTAAAAQSGVPGWPAAPRASFPPGSMSSADHGSRQLTAQRAANMINSGHCKGALRMVLREGDYKMADRIAEVCRSAS